VIPVPIPPNQNGAVGRLWRRPCPQPGGGLGEGFRLGPECLLQDGAVLGLGGPPGTGGPALEGLDEAIIEAPDDKLTHVALYLDIRK